MPRTRYYVGMTTRGGRPVSAEQQDKLARAVVNAYDGGCTIYDAVGYWRGVRENTKVYEVLHDYPNADAGPRALSSVLARIAEQTTVLWTQETVNGGFSS